MLKVVWYSGGPVWSSRAFTWVGSRRFGSEGVLEDRYQQFNE
jgi:hypothetical protein